MSLDNGKVMVPWQLAEEILASGFKAPTLRLVFSMLHQLDLAGVCGPNSPDVCPLIWANCADLRERVGPHGSNSAREIRAAAEEFIVAGMVEQIALLNEATNLQWQFSARIWEHMRARDTTNYVLVDLTQLGSFRSAFQIGIYLNASKRRRSKAPEFLVQFDAGKSEEANKRQLIRGLQSVERVLNWVYFAALELRRDVPEPAHFRVRILHSDARWYFHSYLKFERPKAVWRVDQSGHKRFDPKVVRDERADLVEADGMELDQLA